jgi:hypothetical protein
MKTNDILSENISIVQPTVHAKEPDHEVQMARSELYRAGKCAMNLHNMLKSVSEQQGLEGWVQAKITKAADYLESVYHYLDYEMKSTGLAEAGPIAPGSVPAGSVTTPGDNTPINGASSGNDQLNQQKAAAAVALQRKQIQDQIRATQKQLQDLQKQLQTIGSIASATTQPKVQESASAGASSAGGIASVGMPMGKKKKDVGSLFGGTYKQNEAANAAQQAAIAISKKKSGKYDKDGERIKEAQAAKQDDKEFRLVRPGFWKHHSGKSSIHYGDDSKSYRVMHGDERDPMKYRTLAGAQKAVRAKHVKEGETGPKFTGYWKGTDKGPPGKKMVGGGV